MSRGSIKHVEWGTLLETDLPVLSISDFLCGHVFYDERKAIYSAITFDSSAPHIMPIIFSKISQLLSISTDIKIFRIVFNEKG